MPEVDFGSLFDTRKKKRNMPMPEIPKRFWCFNWFRPGTREVIPDGEHCCWWHFRGLPTREDFDTGVKVRHPMYEFQEDMIRRIEADEKRLYAIMKMPKMGATEFWINHALHKSLIDPVWEDGQAVIVNATRQAESNLILDRCKRIMDNPYNPIPYKHNPNTKSEFTVNRTQFFALPSGNIDAIRSKENARFVLIDESAFFKYMENDEKVKDAAEHYFGSLRYYLVFISTAGEFAKGFFYDLIKDREGEFSKRYHILKWNDPQKYGLKRHPLSNTRMYSEAMLSLYSETDRQYRRNYLGIWGAGSDTIFDHKILDEVTTKKYHIESPRAYPSVLGVDPAYGRGTSKVGARFGMVGMYAKDGILYTDFCDEKRGISENEGKVLIHRAMKRGYTALCIDAANPGLIKDMQKLYYVKPMNFAALQSGTSMIQVLGEEDPKYAEDMKMIDLVENAVSKRKVRVHPDHDSLIDQLRTIQRNEKGLPNKKISRFDLGDAFQMAVYYLSRYNTWGFD